MADMNTKQKITVQVSPVDDAGAPGRITGNPTYPVDVPGIVTVVPSSDGLSADILGAAVGTAIVTPTAVSSSGATITGPAIVVNVTPAPEGPATKLLVSVGPVVSQ